MKRLLLILVLLSIAVVSVSADEYDFDGTISLETIEAYLARSIVCTGICCLGQNWPEIYADDSIRAVENMEPKYIGRAVLGWEAPEDPEWHFRTCRESAARLHEIDPQLLLEASIFEAVYSCKSPEAIEDSEKTGNKHVGVEDIPIPAWVFEAFGLPAENRSFSYEAMLPEDGSYRNLWAAGVSVPDITRQETQLWQYYRACRYIDAGYEAINFGQVGMIGANDTGMKCWAKVLDKVRAYAKKHARRHYVLCTGHFRPDKAKSDGRLLWDFAEFPLRPLTGVKPLNAVLNVGHADSIYNLMPGGIHPAGWRVDILPQAYELDNYFTGIDASQDWMVWGTDEINWFANCTEGYRNYFLRYVCEWLRKNVKRGYLNMPGIRSAFIPISKASQFVYWCNNKSENCPGGGNQENTIKALFARRFDKITQSVSIPERKSVVGEQLGFMPHRAGIAERLFSKASSVIRPNYTNSFISDCFDAFGGSSPGERKESLSGMELLPDKALIDDEGLHLNGPTAEVSSFPEISGGRLSVYMKIRFGEGAFDDSFPLVSKFEYGKNGWYIQYYKPEDSLYAEMFDGDMTIRKKLGFPFENDGKYHSICFMADGKRFCVFYDGKRCGSMKAGKIVPNLQNMVIHGGIAGTLGDIKIFNYALSEKEIRTLATE